jgi:hypothetical protein
LIKKKWDGLNHVDEPKNSKIILFGGVIWSDCFLLELKKVFWLNICLERAEGEWQKFLTNTKNFFERNEKTKEDQIMSLENVLFISSW